MTEQAGPVFSPRHGGESSAADKRLSFFFFPCFWLPPSSPSPPVTLTGEPLMCCGHSAGTSSPSYRLTGRSPLGLYLLAFSNALHILPCDALLIIPVGIIETILPLGIYMATVQVNGPVIH